MSTIEARIQEAAAKNRELHRILAETDHALPDLENQKRFVADLEKDVQEATKRIQALDQMHKKELHEHEKYRDNVMRRFAYKATGQKGKFEARVEKEEKEYFEAMQEEHREKEMKKNLLAKLDEAKRVARDLEAEAQKHADMQTELDNLYSTVFAGPASGFPEGDARERESEAALQSYRDTRTKAATQLRAATTLKNAKELLIRAMSAMDDALKHSHTEIFGGGTISDMMERNALHKAQTVIQEARQTVEMARREDPQIASLAPVNIHTGKLMADVFFDKVFADVVFEDEIKKGRLELEQAAHKLDKELAEATGRHKALEEALRQRKAELESARVELQKSREKAFEQVARST